MFTDMVGYTALGQRNESLSLALVKEQRKVIRPILGRHNGREVKTMGDAFLVEFPNASDAVRCAYDVQRAVREFNLSLDADRRIHLRIGVHVGEVVDSQGDISGDAVNIASRIEPLADDGGVCITRQVYDHVKNKVDFALLSIGSKSLKNVTEPMDIYRMVMPWDKERPVPEELETRRVAVLPFVNLSPDPNDSYFADGVTEEIISTVSSVSGLSVVSRTSVAGYKGTTKKVAEIGNELGVGSVLEGSLRKAGTRVRITTQLIDVKSDSHVWSENYDRELNDIFAVQSDVAEHVANALRVRILPPELERVTKIPTESTKAYSLYLRGRFHWNKRGIEDIKKAMEYFQLAIDEDRNFALGYCGLADCHELTAANWGIDRGENHARAKDLVERALQVDPELAEAHATRGLILHHDFDPHQAEEELKRAIELKPSYATAHHWYFHVLHGQLRWDEALREIERAVELDPFSLSINLNHAWYYSSKRNYGKALELGKRALELGPNSASAHMQLAWEYHNVNLLEDARREIDIADSLARDSFPQIQHTNEVVMAYFEDDRSKVARLLPLVEDAPGKVYGFDALDFAGLYFYLGKTDEGFAWLERSFARKEPFLAYLKSNELFDGVRGDPRYKMMLKKLGLGEAE